MYEFKLYHNEVEIPRIVNSRFENNVVNEQTVILVLKNLQMEI